jgi:hypothetical protein
MTSLILAVELERLFDETSISPRTSIWGVRERPFDWEICVNNCIMRDGTRHPGHMSRSPPYPLAPHRTLLLIMPPHLPPSTGPPSTGRPWQRHHRRTRHRAAGHGGSPRAMRLSEEPPLSRRSHSATAAGKQAPQKPQCNRCRSSVQPLQILSATVADPQCNRCRSSIRLQSSSTLTSIPSTTFSILGRSRLRNVSMRSPSMKLVASWVFRSVRNSRHF